MDDALILALIVNYLDPIIVRRKNSKLDSFGMSIADKCMFILEYGYGLLLFFSSSYGFVRLIPSKRY